MRYGSVCSGIEAASVAWHSLGWQSTWFAEIDPFPSAVLAHRFPGVPNLGDFTKIEAEPGSIDLLVGGTPCQSFSVAGLRRGLDDDRGNLALEFLRLAGRARPVWVVWENVPGVLSSNGGRDFGAFLGGLAELGYGWAYRVLDAQYFGVPQRRRRVFVVGCFGDWRRAAAVLFERHSLSGNSPPGREAQPDIAPSVAPGDRRASGQRSGEKLTVTGCQAARYGKGTDSDACDPMAFNWQTGGSKARLGYASHPTALQTKQIPALHDQFGIRRLTPRECERLQGLPDDWTLVPWRGGMASDSPRYLAIGNSMAVPVMAWIGQRTQRLNRGHIQ